jgi:SAM-dependent methyltransferase
LAVLKYKIESHLDDPKTTLLHREIIKSKPFLKKVYEEWYNELFEQLKNSPKGKVLEIGSGGGFLKEMQPNVITSDILPLDCCDMTFSAEKMPFENGSLTGIVMVNVFHHIPKPTLFLQEAQRTLQKGGRIVMIEPANSILGRFIYQNFHHEPFDPSGRWEIESSGPLSGSNQALPYIYFERDQKKFREEFPELKIVSIRYQMLLRYLISGGVSRKAMVPSWSFSFFKFMETILSPLSKQLGMFETIVAEKI